MKNLQVYKSSAGSGKTFALVKSILLKILSQTDPSYYRHILALTFTNKAANEMKQRLLKYLKILSKITTPEKDHTIEKEINENLDLTPAEIQNRALKVLGHMIHNYSDLALSTIDKFNHKIVRQFSRDLQLEHDFDVELEEHLVIERAVDKLLSRIGSDSKTTDLILNYVLFNIDQEISWSLRSHLINHGKILIKESNRKAIQALGKIKDEEWNKMRNQIKKKIKTIADKLKDNGESALMLISESQIPPAAFKGGENRAIHAFFQKASRSEFFNPINQGSKYILADEWFSGKANDSDKYAIDNIKGKLNEKFSAIYESLAEDPEKRTGYTFCTGLQIILRESYPMQVILELEEILGDLKKENNFILISDINRKINDVVLNNPAPFIYEKLGEQYKNYYLDEFQDTSVMQWNNVIPLVEDSLAKGNLSFIVGDAKQAIYRFRGGQSKQLTDLPQLPYLNGSTSSWTEKTFTEHYQENKLEHNYRSGLEIVHFNNFLFGFLKNVLPQSIRNYYQDHEQIPAIDASAYVEINFAADYKDSEIFLAKISECVADSVEDGFSLNDIAILVRTARQGQDISKHLLSTGISVLSADSLLLNENREVMLVLDWMRLSVDKDNTAASLSLMRHSANDFKHSELLKFKKGKSFDFFSYFKLEHEFNLEEISALPLVDQAVSITKLLDFFPFNPYIESFIDVTHEYALKHGNNMVEFLNYWEERKGNFSLRSTQNSEAVQILTIHKAKGLEFPVVIVPLMKSGRSNSNWIWVNTQNVAGNIEQMLVPFNKKLEYSIFKTEFEEERKNQLLDELNILYVAFTRPENRLYVLSSPPSKTSETVDSILKNGILKAIKTHEATKSDSTNLRLGKRHARERKMDKKIPKFEFYNTGNYRQTIPFGRLSNLDVELEKPRALRFGSIVHALLAEMITFDDEVKALQNIDSHFSISENELLMFKDLILKLKSNKQVCEWFMIGDRIKTEAEILSEEGKIYRPDRIIFKENKTIIVDFKTGSQRKEHKTQITNYQELITQIGFENTEAYLCYVMDEVDIISL